MSRKPSRLSRVLTERSIHVSQPADSQWLEYLEDSRVSVPPGIVPDKSRLSEAIQRRSKWWVDVDDSVDVPPPLSAGSGSRLESSFSSGNEMSGKRPAAKTKIPRDAKRRRATGEGFDNIFHQDEQVSKTGRGSSVKHSSSGSLYEETSPVLQPVKAAQGAHTKKPRKSQSSKYGKAFDESDDDIFPSSSRRVAKATSDSSLLSDRSESPATKSKQTSKKILNAKKSGNKRPDVEISFSDNDDRESTDEAFDDSDNDILPSSSRRVLKATSDLSLLSGRSDSPANKPKQTSKKILNARKSQNKRPDMEISFSEDDKHVSSDVDVEKLSSHLDKSLSPISRLGKNHKRGSLSKQRKSATTSAFDNVFDEDEDDEPSVRSPRKALRPVTDKSLSPVSKPGKEHKKASLSKQRKSATTSAFDNVFDEDEDDEPSVRSPRKALRSVTDKSQSPPTKSERTSKKILNARKSQNKRPDMEISFSDDDEHVSSDIDVEKLSSHLDKSLSPISKPGKDHKKASLSKQQKSATTSAFDNVFDEDEEPSVRTPKKSLRPVTDNSLSPISKPGKDHKKASLSKQQKSATTSAFDNVFDEDEEPSVRTPKKSLSPVTDKSLSPISKPGKDHKKASLSKQQKSATTSAFDNVFNEDEEPSVRTPKKSLRPVTDKSLSPPTKSERTSKKILSARKSQNKRPEMEISFSDDDEHVSSDIDVEKLSNPSDKSPSPVSKPDKILKNVRSSKSRSSKYGKTFEDSDNDIFSSPSHQVAKGSSELSLHSDRSPATESKRTSKKILSGRKSGNKRSALEISFSDDDDRKSTDIDVEKLSSDLDKSPVSKAGKGLKKASLSKQQKPRTASAFENVFDEEEDNETSYRSLKNSRLAPNIAQSPATDSQKPSERNLLLKKSRTRSDKDKELLGKKSRKTVSPDIDIESNDDTLGGLNTRRASKRLSASRTESLSKRQSSVASAGTSNLSGRKQSPRRSDTGRVDSLATKPASIVNSLSNSRRSLANRSLDSSTNINKQAKKDQRQEKPGKNLADRVSSNSVASSKGTKKIISPNKSSIMELAVDDSLRSRSTRSRTQDKKAEMKNLTKDSSRSQAGSDNDDANNNSVHSKVSKLQLPVTPQNPRTSLMTGSSNKSRIVYASDPDGLGTLSRKTKEKAAADRSNRDTTPDTSQKTFGPQKTSMITPITAPSTLAFAHEANFTNFNPRANSTKVLHVSSSSSSVASGSEGMASEKASLRDKNLSSATAENIVSATAGAALSPNKKGAENLSLRKEQNEDLSDADVSVIGSWIEVGSNRNPTISDTSEASTDNSEDVAPKKSVPVPAPKPPAQAPILAAPVKKYSAEEAAARRKEYFATLLQRAKASFPHLVAGAPVKQKAMTDFFPKTAALPKVRKEPKPVHPSLLVDGKRWRPPKLARPAQWCTDRYYAFVQKRTKELYGELKMRRKSEEFTEALAISVKKAIRNKKNFQPHVLRAVYLLKRLGLIDNLQDFYHFVWDYIPGDFCDVAVPQRRAYGVTTGPKCFINANVKEPIDFSKFPDFEK